jgi:hypothetical protein
MSFPSVNSATGPSYAPTAHDGFRVQVKFGLQIIHQRPLFPYLAQDDAPACRYFRQRDQLRPGRLIPAAGNGFPVGAVGGVVQVGVQPFHQPRRGYVLQKLRILVGSLQE